MIHLLGKTAIVTGASRGIGAATATRLAEAGIRGLVINYNRDREAAEAVAARCAGLGAEALLVRADVSRPGSAARMIKRTVEHFGALDILVANAGVWKRAAIDSMSEGEWDETIRVNLKSIYACCRHAAEAMIGRGRGTMILISSTAGQRGEAFHSHYAATKGAIISMTKSLAAELGPRGITVNCVAPGWVATDMTARTLADPKQKRKIRELIPLGRVATPEEIAGPVLFLASDLASFVNGEVLNVNGGSVLCG
ncbi:MAG TPA: SDR family NAD(P)-dependent oxidoreductase [Blastocatellia bacterium]|jgi:3-oxoacyl-[acyl-carrier protein] reductase|nr:SDR family NAD(P)-dependent oxidoreductase [Blastocatellia bacterium]